MVSPLDGWPVQVGIALGLLLSLLIVRGLDRPRGRWGTLLRSRFLFGVPWGTLVSVAGVVGVYLFVQDGWNHWGDPVVLPFASWSYLYPLGAALGSFSHAGPGHLLGNMTSTLAVAPLAEYYFSHYPTERGESSFGSWRTNPWVRAFVLFPLGVAVVGLVTSVFAWGPVIGFSGVVFAFIGFALVRYPLGTVVALTAQGAIRTIYDALRDPRIVAEASSSYSDPWWFGIAVQGHTLGFVVGAVVGVYLLRKRRVEPNALRTWVGAFLILMSVSLWALWWYQGEERYALFRGLGVLFVVTLALLVTFAVRTTDRGTFGPRARQTGAVLLLVPLVVMAGIAIPFNLTTVENGTADLGSGVSIRDYTVAYAEDVPNRKVSAVDVSFAGETTQVNTSGVIVVNEGRELWSREVSKGKLAHSGRATVRVGGVAWSDAVHVKRQGWSAIGGGTAYQVWLRPPAGAWRHAFSSDGATAGPVLAGTRISVVPQNRTFVIELARNDATVATVPLPRPGSSVSAGGLTFEREDDRIYGVVNDTRVQVAKRETYRN